MKNNKIIVNYLSEFDQIIFLRLGKTLTENYETKNLKEENEKIKKQLETYSHSQKEYYQKNKDIVNEKAKERLKKIAQDNPDKLKEYRKTAYLKRKEKLKNLEKKEFI